MASTTAIATSSVPSVEASILFIRVEGTGRDALVRAAAASWPDDERAVLDAPQGAVIVGLGDPARALNAARGSVAAEPDARIGVHHGTVEVIGDGESGWRVQGESIDAAIAAASAAQEPVLTTPAFRDALARHSAERQRRTLIGAAAVAGLLGVGWAIRTGRRRWDDSRKPAAIQLDIRPWGEVYVDGELKGVAPPLIRLWIKPGDHSIEVRNAKFKPLKLEVNLQPGEQMELKHVFSANPPRRPSLLERLKFW